MIKSASTRENVEKDLEEQLNMKNVKRNKKKFTKKTRKEFST